MSKCGSFLGGSSLVRPVASRQSPRDGGRITLASTQSVKSQCSLLRIRFDELLQRRKHFDNRLAVDQVRFELLIVIVRSFGALVDAEIRVRGLQEKRIDVTTTANGEVLPSEAVLLSLRKAESLERIRVVCGDDEHRDRRGHRRNDGGRWRHLKAVARSSGDVQLEIGGGGGAGRSIRSSRFHARSETTG